MGDFDLMPGSNKGGPPKRNVYYQYSGPPPVDEPVKEPTPTEKNKNVYVEEEIDDKELDIAKNNSMDIKKVIIIGAVVFIIILIIIVSIIVYIVMKNKNNTKNTKNKKTEK
jgi:hypothetical protein